MIWLLAALFAAPHTSIALLPSAPVVAVSDVVPFYSQFKDIASPVWQKRGCGVASLAMVIDYFKPDAVTVNKLLAEGIAASAYDYSAGWKHHGLVLLAQTYGLTGNNYDLSGLGGAAALKRLTTYLADGPVIVSVHYKFEPTNPIPHLVVIDSITGGIVTYNDPAAKTGAKQISVVDFQKAWKKKLIVIRPKPEGNLIALAQ